MEKSSIVSEALAECNQIELLDTIMKRGEHTIWLKNDSLPNVIIKLWFEKIQTMFDSEPHTRLYMSIEGVLQVSASDALSSLKDKLDELERTGWHFYKMFVKIKKSR